MNAIVVEDDLESRELLCEYVNLHSRLNLLGSAGTGADALELIKDSLSELDLIFLDIQLPDMSGVEIAQMLDESIVKVFCTAMQQYALKAFDIGAIDYLIKPISQEKFNRSAERALNGRPGSREEVPVPVPGSAGGEPGIFLKGHSGVFSFVRFDQLMYLEAQGKRTAAYVYPNSEVECAQMLKEVESRLPAGNFRRIHRQYIVNLNYVSRIEYLMGGSYLLYLNDEERSTLPMGRKFFEDFRRLMK